LIISVSGCATLTGTTTSLNTNAACHTADVATTAASLAKGNVETNPLINAIRISSLGSVWGTIVPLAAIAVATHYVLKAIHIHTLNAVDSADACWAAGNNVGMILK